jgi:transposase
MGRSRGGLTSKIHAVVDPNGLPVHLALTPGEAHDNRLCSVLLGALLPKIMLLADRGYDADWIRGLAREQGAWANIPPKRNRKDPICFSPYLYRARNLIERFFNKIKQCRRVAPDMTSWQPITWHSSSSHQSAFGSVLMSPRPTSVASAPDLGWRPSIYFRKHGVESTQAAETSMHGNLRHRKVGLVEKPLGPLDAGGLSDLHRAGAQVSLEQPGQMP